MSGTGCMAVMMLAHLTLAGQAGPDGPMTLETLRQRVARNEDLIDPIKLAYRAEFSRTGELPQPAGGRRAGPWLSHMNVVWAQGGSRHYIDHHSFYGPNEPALSTLTVLDGETRTHVDLPERIRISIESMSVPNVGWFDVLTVRLGLRPFQDQVLLSEALVPSYAVLQHDTQTIGGRFTCVVDATHPGRSSCVRLWIDPGMGLPLRVCTYDQHPTAPQAQVIAEVNEITPYRLPNGGWIPVAGVRTLHVRRANPPFTSYEHISVDVNSITIEPDDIPNSLFQIDPPQGATVYDALSGRTTTHGQPLRTYEQLVRGGGRYIAGTVVDGEGVPVAGAVVTRFGIEPVRSDGRPGFPTFVQPYERISTLTDARGRFALEVEQEGNHDLVFYHDDFADKRVRRVSPDEHDLGVVLERGGAVTGRVFHATGGDRTPLAEVRVSARAGDRLVGGHMRNHRMIAITDAQGRFEIRGLPTQVRDRSVAPSEPPRYVPLSWLVRCGSASRSVTFDRDAQTREVELVVKPDVRMAASLVGRPMPNLDGLGLNVAREQLEGRRVLICFFDLEQRPARNCVEELARRAASLKDQGVTILAVHGQPIDAARLKTWMDESGITLPIGIIIGDPEEIKFAWAARSLPWLILADAEHIVRAEGSALDELDDVLSRGSETRK